MQHCAGNTPPCRSQGQAWPALPLSSQLILLWVYMPERVPHTHFEDCWSPSCLELTLFTSPVVPKICISTLLKDPYQHPKYFARFATSAGSSTCLLEQTAFCQRRLDFESPPGVGLLFHPGPWTATSTQASMAPLGVQDTPHLPEPHPFLVYLIYPSPGSNEGRYVAAT